MTTQISRDNNFDTVRLLAALQVCIRHIMAHFSLENQWGGVKRIIDLFPGVISFFAISGFLVTMSWTRSGSVKKYARNRFLRLYPALIGGFILVQVALVVFGHLRITSLADPQVWAYWAGQLSLGQFFTPDSLRGFGCGTPNGSLWTIPVEIEFYMALPIVFMVGKRMRPDVKLAIVGGLSLIYNIVIVLLVPESTGSHQTNAAGMISMIAGGNILPLLKLVNVTVIPYLYCFVLGGLLYLHWNKVRKVFEGKAVYWLGLYIIAAWATGSHPAYFIRSGWSILLNILLGCLTISAAFSLGKLYKLLKGNDISYGVYIIHMVIVNVMLELGYCSTLWHAVIAVALSVILAFLSCKFIEQPALRLKYN